ncbi:MAG: hypothetical protein V5A55_05110 [Halovenus sp.]
MVSKKRRSALFAALTAAMLLLSGTAGVAFAATPATHDVQDERTPDGDEVIEEFRDRIESLETVEFTRTEQVTYDNETTTNSVRVHADLEDAQKRVETVSGPTNTTRVWDDGNVVMYDADDNTVSEYEVTGTSLLPGVQGLANESLLNYEYLGTDTIDGQETYVLEAVRDEQTQQNDDIDASMTLYIDTETYFPVRTELQASSEDVEHSSVVSYENVTLGEEIPDSTFELDLPDDVEDLRENSIPGVSEHETYDAVASNTDLPVPAAELTDDFSFDSGVVVNEDDFRSVTLTYTDGEGSVSVIVHDEPITGVDHSESDRYDSVDVGNTTAYLSTGDDFTSLYVEGDQPYTVYGGVTEETSIDIAEALLDEERNRS